MSDDLALPRPPGVIRRFFLEHPWLTDALVATASLLFAGLSLIVSAVVERDAPPWLPLLLVVAGAAALLFRRRSPVAVFVATHVLFVLGTPLSGGAEQTAALFAAYAVGVYRSTKAAWACFGGGVAAVVVAATLAASRAGSADSGIVGVTVETSFASEWTTYLASGTIGLLIATLIGTNIGGRRRYVAALVERAAQLARERDQQAEIASARERERIAREMHDVIAHSLSVMIALAEGAAATGRADPERAREVMGRVAETGRRTLGEVRRLLGTVRAETAAELAPQPGSGDLPSLAAEFQRAGLPVRLTLAGEHPVDPALDLTVYRLVQESLTNALRHARGVTAVTAAVTWTPDAVEVVVDDDGSGEPTGDAGRGLVGMRERAALYDGELEAGPRPGGGWRVRARLPRTEEPT